MIVENYLYYNVYKQEPKTKPAEWHEEIKGLDKEELLV